VGKRIITSKAKKQMTDSRRRKEKASKPSPFNFKKHQKSMKKAEKI